MYEYKHHNGDHYIIFDIIETNIDNATITVAISNQGKIVQDTFDLLNIDDAPYFEYGLYQEKIYLNDFVNL